MSLSVVPEFSAAASSNNTDLFEIMKVASIISATGPQSHGRRYPSYSSGSLPASNASVVSPNIIMLTVQSLPFILTMKPSYSVFTFENLLIANAIRRETFILLSVIRLT
jgi:hypothetical protein